MQDFDFLNYPDLPITQHREIIIEAIKNNQVVIVAGETGSGKTTQLPKMCMEAGLGKKMIGCTQPRRIAAVSVSARVADELGEIGKDLVGYKIRFTDKTSRQTKIKFLTDGMLLAEAQNDRNLSRYDTIIIDEAHERSLNIDFLIGILKTLLAKNIGLKVIISSATIDVEKFANFFKGAPVIEVSGRSYPIETFYHETTEDKEEEEVSYVELAVKKVVELEKNKQGGDVLIFMPTERDIIEVVESIPAMKGLTVIPLFGRMGPKEQKKIFGTISGRKVVVATNVAETSITVPGIRFVIDSGVARISGYNARARTTKLPIRQISKASADQRKGRCGRVGPGICFRLYSQENYNNRPDYTPPEIVRSNLAEVILRMAHLRLGHPARFPFLDAPSSRSISDGFKLLVELGAVRGDYHKQLQTIGLTKRGNFMARLPVDPKIARMIIEASHKNCLQEVLIISAALSVQDPRLRPIDKQKEAAAAHAKFVEPGSDFLTYLNIWQLYHHTAISVKSKTKLRKFCQANFLGWQRMREWCDIYEQLCKVVGNNKNFVINSVKAPADAVHQAILSGSLRSIGFKKLKNLYLGGQGKELMLFPGSGIFNKGGQWIMAGEIVETSRLYARTVANIDPGWIEPLAGPLCKYSYSDPHYEKKMGHVVAKEKVTLFGLTISMGRKINYARINRLEARQIFIQKALVEGELNKNYDFFTHNSELIDRLQSIDERIRRRNVVDDYSLFLFYDKRIPDEIVDIRGLDKVIGKIGKSLFMKNEDVLLEDTDQNQLDQFPSNLKIDSYNFQLTYKFSPGSIEDGVTLHVPIDVLAELKQSRFDWLVPGLINEKVLWLFKGLPKRIRKQLVPIGNTVDQIISNIEFGKGNLFKALEDAVFKKYMVKILRTDWQIENLPDHLKMRFCLLKKSKVLFHHRDFSKLLGQEHTGGIKNLIAKEKEKYEKFNIKEWDFNALPERIPIYDNSDTVAGFAYPGLKENSQGGIDLLLFTDEMEKRVNTAGGVAALYKNYLGREFKEAAKRYVLQQSEWPLFEGLGNHKEINRQILRMIIYEIFELHDGIIPTDAEFNEKVTHLKGAVFFHKGQELFDRLKNVLAERRETIDHLNSFERKAKSKNIFIDGVFKTARKQIMAVIPSLDNGLFFTDRLELIPKYLKAIRIRVERAYANPEQDLRKMTEISPFEEKITKLASLLSNVKNVQKRLALSKMAEEYKIMVEEYRVSLFAQELKTSMPVSAKRLQNKWQEFLEMVN